MKPFNIGKNNTLISVKELSELQALIENLSNEELNRVYPFLGKRVLTVRGGVAVLKSVFNQLNLKELKVSTYGLRYGLIFSGNIDEQFIFRGRI